MKRFTTVVALAALAILSTSCAKSRMEKMQLAKDVVITCTPEVMEIKGGKIPVTLTATCPKGYFEPQATMDVTPVLVYEGGEQAGRLLQYQGDKVKDNFKVIPSAGGTVTEKLVFKYVPGCEKAHLELRAVINYKKKSYDVDPVKVADGCIATYQLAKLQGSCEPKPDGYQAVIQRSTEGRILYDVNSDKVKNSELGSLSMETYMYSLLGMNENERTTVKGTQIIAYASPEGGQEYNAKLSDNRARTAEKAWGQISQGLEVTGTEVQSIGQDWEGFQEAVSKSNIEDKDLILRVLSMYSDPEVRENEIRNMSQIYAEINKTVFPELRRARFVTSSEWRNYSDEELEQIAAKSLENLDEPALLHLAAVTKDEAMKENLYKVAIDRFNSNTARYNLALYYLGKGKVSLAGAYLSKIKAVDADVLNATGVVALRNDDYEQAALCFAKADTPIAKDNLCALYILQGDYDSAVKVSAGTTGINTAVANVLAGNLDAASEALTCQCPRSNYIRAIIAARKGNTATAREYLDKACEKSEALKERSVKDIEFASLAN